VSAQPAGWLMISLYVWDISAIDTSGLWLGCWLLGWVQGLLRVAEVDLFERVWRQEQAVDVPATLARHAAQATGKVLVVGFQEAIVAPVPGRVRAHVGAKQDAIGVLQEEAPRGVGLPAQLANAGADVHVEVGAAVEHSTDPGQVL